MTQSKTKTKDLVNGLSSLSEWFDDQAEKASEGFPETPFEDAIDNSIYAKVLGESSARLEELDSLVRQFVKYLNLTEESDSGTIFHPVTIGCSRAMMLNDLGNLIKKMEDSVND
jgi:hypothetical protein